MASPILPRVTGLAFGGDYNPEQWPADVWAEDMKLMREAGVNLATVNVFSWDRLQPGPGRFEFGELDRIMDMLHEAGVAADLATATASPPPWFSHAYPETLPVDADGRRLTYGSRQAFCPSSPVYRDAAVELASRLAERYGDHPALATWHVHNEYGCQNPQCYCEVSAEAFRDWLRARYGGLDALNHAWGTTFWAQTYSEWQQVQPPRATMTTPNPTQILDFRRYCSDALLELYKAERDVLRDRTPEIPVTTNIMVTGNFASFDYWKWSAELTGARRFVSVDHYLQHHDHVEEPAQIAYAADRARSIARGGPWLLMENATSSLGWRPRNFAKAPGRLVRDAIGYVARGSEGALFFQWRASRYGGEKWHSAMVPHAGTDSKIWRDVVTLGGYLSRLGEIAGSTVDAEVAVLYDHASGWAAEGPSQPSAAMTTYPEVRRWHAALWRRGVVADIAHPSHDLSRYEVVVVPALYLVTDAEAANLAEYAAAGGTLVVGPYSGIADENDHIRLGGYPGAFRELLGVYVDEFFPVDDAGEVRLTDGSTGRLWTENARADGARVVASYVDGPVAGAAAVTRRAVGAGEAWYVGTRLVDADLGRLLAGAGARPLLPGMPPGLEAVRRRHADGRSYLFLINHGAAEAVVGASGTDVLTGTGHDGSVVVPGEGVVVLRERV